MDAKTVSRGPNAPAGPFTRSTANVARPRAWSVKPVSSTANNDQYGLLCTRNSKTYPWTGLGHQHPHHPDHHRMCIQERSLKVAECPVPGLRAPPNHEYLGPSYQGRNQGCRDRVARSALPQNPRVYVLVPAVPLGWGNEYLPQ